MAKKIPERLTFEDSDILINKLILQNKTTIMIAIRLNYVIYSIKHDC